MTRYHLVGEDGKVKLLSLQAAGHEIGSHSYSHKNALEYSEETSVGQYVEEEVCRSIELMAADGLHVTSFAYPFGYNDDDLDTEILRQVEVIRDITDFQRTALTRTVDSIDEIFYPGDHARVVTGLGIDAVFGLSLDELDAAFARAARNGEVIVLYAHRPVEEAVLPYDIQLDYLGHVLLLAKKHKLTSYKVSQLPAL